MNVLQGVSSEKRAYRLFAVIRLRSLLRRTAPLL